jgi:hypothetical protein
MSHADSAEGASMVVPPVTATRVKGSALAPTLRFIRETFGEIGLERVLHGLSPEDQNILQHDMLASSWYPFSLMVRFMRESERCFGAQSPRLLRDMGRAAADYNMTTIYRIFFKLGSPQFTLSRAARVFGNFYDTGDLEAIVNEKGHAICELRGFGEPAPEFCERLIGWMEHLIALTGGTDLVSSHPRCVNRGDATCHYEGHWTQR